MKSGLVGKKFERWTVISSAPQHSTKTGPLYKCRCVCGTEKVIRASSLTCGDSRSCGCLHRELSAARETRHGHTKGSETSAEWRVWRNMRARCMVVGSQQWERYGGRGIRICQRWVESFEAFYEDMGPRPSPTHSLDRIDNDGDYSKANCRWATPSEQSTNRRTTRFLTFQGKTQSMSAWASEVNVSKEHMHRRLTQAEAFAKYAVGRIQPV